MSIVATEPATPDRFDDVQRALTGGGDGASCQCRWWQLANKDWPNTTRDERREQLRVEITDGPAPGIVAYVDGEAAGWVRVGPRPNQPRLARTRNYAGSPEPWDDADVWAVTCFAVRKEFRGRGLNAELLTAAIAYATTSGARIIEAYPLDASLAKTSSSSLYHGALSTFLNAGFSEIARPKPNLAIVQLTLAKA